MFCGLLPTEAPNNGGFSPEPRPSSLFGLRVGAAIYFTNSTTYARRFVFNPVAPAAIYD